VERWSTVGYFFIIIREERKGNGNGREKGREKGKGNGKGNGRGNGRGETPIIRGERV
jgi:hypothetical protein